MIVSKVETKHEYTYYTMSDGKIFYMYKSYFPNGEDAYDLGTGNTLNDLKWQWIKQNRRWFARNPYIDYINAIDSYVDSQRALRDNEERLKKLEKVRQIYFGE